MDILNADAIKRDTFHARAQQHLRADFNSLVSSTTSHEFERKWIERAWFLSELDDVELSSFRSLGFECIESWYCNPSVVFSLAMSLLHQIPSIPDRLTVVKTWVASDHADFIVELLTAISEAPTDFSLTTKCRNRNDRSALLINAIGGNKLDNDFVYELAARCIDKVGNIVNGEVNDSSIQPRIAVLRVILETKFRPVHIYEIDKLFPEEIKENDNLWYITDPKASQSREEVQVLKVHFDSMSGFYFSILLKRDGKYIERQTVVERLRKQQLIETSIDTSQNSVNGEERNKLCSHIWNKLLVDYNPIISRHNLGDLINVLVTVMGLGEKRGIGSFHYEVLQLLLRIESSMIGAFENSDHRKLKQLLWTMSLTLGFGLNSQGSSHLLSQMWRPTSCVFAVLDFYSKHGVGNDNELDAAVAAFLTAFGGMGKYSFDNTTIEQFTTFLFDIATSILTHANPAALEMASLLAYSAISQGIVHMKSTAANGSPVIDALEFALNIAIKRFSEPGNFLQQDSVQISHLDSAIVACSKRTELCQVLSRVCTCNSSKLCECLFVPSKRSFAFTLFEFIAARGKEFARAENVVLSAETTLNLKAWSDTLNDDDIAILEEDLYIVAGWLPQRLMVEVEGWEEAGFELENECTIVGRLLSWFCVLRFIESAAPHDFRNRSAFINYLDRCSATCSILNLGLLHNDIINMNDSFSVPAMFDISEILSNNLRPNITRLATLSLFRTVEVLPSLCRKWWENDCPRVYATAVQALIEKFVAPEIFKREIDRLKASTSFGKMAVTANITSREIAATYIQDDFTLKVLIVLPSFFPFRSAEVDCSKTLGVPQSRWKRWSLQITMMLNAQGGTLQDALILWKDNVDKEFEGVEPCPVCYSVLHVKTHKLPSLQCKTCNNRFHVECLTEWFRSSGKSHCVLCQQPWQGTRV
jgi:hypothetical protein